MLSASPNMPKSLETLARVAPFWDSTPMMPQPTFIENGTEPIFVTSMAGSADRMIPRQSGSCGSGGAVPTTTYASTPGAARLPHPGFIPLALITAVAAGVVR
jgi:hypothetical protein